MSSSEQSGGGPAGGLAETLVAPSLAPEPAPASLSAPETLLHYRLMEKLGEGGMGAVFKAEDQRLARTVAIKRLLQEDAGRRGRARPPGARGARGVGAEPPQHRHHLRHRGERGRRVPRHGIPPGGDARGADRARAARPGARVRARRRDRGRARVRARGGAGPPRHQAGQRDDHHARQRQGARLRDRQGGAGRLGRAPREDLGGRDCGDGAVHVPRAAPRPAGGRAERRLRARLRPLRGGDGAAGVPRGRSRGRWWSRC